MAWIGVITNAGAALLAQWAAGDHTLTIDGAKVGSGYVPEANMRIMTDLSSEKDDAEIVSAEEVTGGTQFRIRVSAVDGESYTAHEIGLWAHIDDGDPVMIAYHQDSGIGVTVPTAASMPGFFFDLYCVHAIGNEGELTIVLSDTTFATRDELQEDIASVESKVADTEETSVASKEYAVEEYLIYSGNLYKVTDDISPGDTLTPGTNIEETKVTEELSALEGTLNSIIQQSAFEIVVEDNELILYWHGVEDECPYEITLENGEYVLNYVYESVS